jgi:hypothetical protein
MTRRWFSVIAVLGCVLAITPSASAECAWVLWETTSWPTKKTSTEPVRAYTAKPDCDQALSEALAGFTSSPGVVVNKDLKLQEAFVTMGKATTSHHYVCLPDTVDPRGPKGK